MESLDSALYIYIPANPNRIAAIEPVLARQLENELLPLLINISET